MRARKNMKSTVAALALVMTIAALTSCGEPTCSWRSAGIHQARVSNLTVPDTIASDEVLAIQFYGDTEIFGEPTLSSIDTVRKSTEIELTVWAEVTVFCDPVPPFATSFMVDYQVLPPFDPGEFRVVINQPDGSQLVESVLIEP